MRFLILAWLHFLQWLFPNGQGGRGLPRYIKQTEPYEEGHEYEGEEVQETEA